MSIPLSDLQEFALRRALGSHTDVKIVMMARGSHYVRVSGGAAMVLSRSHALPDGRNIRFAKLDDTIYAADVAA